MSQESVSKKDHIQDNRAEQGVYQSEMYYKTLFYQAPDGYLILKDGVFMDCNNVAAALIGGTREDIIGKSPENFSPPYQPNGMSSKELAKEILSETLQKGKYSGEWLHTRLDGSAFLSSMTIAALEYDQEPVVLVAWHDITHQRQMEKALLLSEQRFRQVTGQSKILIWEVDCQGHYTYINDISTEIYGYAPSELVGKTYCYELHPIDFRKEYKLTVLDCLSTGESVINYDNPILRKDGSIVWVSTNASPIRDANHRIIGYRGSDKDISHRLKYENELRRFRSISDQANYGTAIATLDGHIIYCNNSYAWMHGYRKEEIIGMNIHQFYTEHQRRRIESLMEAIKYVGSVGAEEVWRKKKDGSLFPSLMSVGMVVGADGKPEYMAATVMDISDMKKKEQELQKLTLAIEQSPVAIVITDLTGLIEYASPAIETLTGYSSREVIGMHTRTFKSGMTSNEYYDQFWKTIRSGRQWHGEWQNRKKNGELYWESITVSPIMNDKDEIVNYLADKIDITTSKQAEQDRIARSAAEEANRAKTAFLSSMSHEIRTPLNAIMGFAQILMRDTTLSPKQAEQVGTIMRSGEHLFGLINDILDLSRIEADQAKLKCICFCLHDLLDDLKMMFEVRTNEKGLQLLLNRHPDVPQYVFGDEAKLRQIMINLIGNAVKFTEKGGISIRVDTRKPKEFSLSESPETVYLCIEVEDTGPGISKEDQEHIFDTFWQNETGQKAGGTGLGLPISKKLVDLLGGRLGVKSQVGRGSIFQLLIPVIPAAEGNPQKKATGNHVRGLAPEIGPIRILIVDDQKENVVLLTELLQPIGFEVKGAYNGQQAIEIFEAWSPHAILMDISMPIMDGYEATTRIKGTEKGKSTRIIAVTASVFESEIEKVMATGMDEFIRKPFKVEELYTALGKVKGVKYVYGEVPSESVRENESPIISHREIMNLPESLIKEMSLAVEQGNISKLRELINEVEKVDVPIARVLQNLAKQYDYDKLSTLLRR